LNTEESGMKKNATTRNDGKSTIRPSIKKTEEFGDNLKAKKLNFSTVKYNKILITIFRLTKKPQKIKN